MALRAHQKNLELVLEIERDVPGQVIGDPIRLSQVLVNLIGNAMKFTEQRRGAVEAARSADRSSGTAECELHFLVQDTGIGIPADKLQLIFDAFTQADGSMTRNYGGTGLGLAIATRLTELMGGRIWVESESGKGSRFHFTLRVRGASGREREAARAGVEALRGLRVLAVDDNGINRRVI